MNEEVAMRIPTTSPAARSDAAISGTDPPSSRPCCAKDLFRIGFGLIWLIDAGFKWQSGFGHQFRDMINSAGQGQPSWLHWFYTFTHNVFTPHPYVWAYAVASIETLIGLALVLGFARKSTYIVTAITGLGIWAIAEGFGGPYNSGSTDIGAAVMYAVVVLGLLALNYEAGPSRFSVAATGVPPRER
jgi:nitrite reductase (NO-forming)